MARNIEAGVRRTVLAKLLERGMAEDAANALMESKLADALAYFAQSLTGYQAVPAADATLETVKQGHFAWGAGVEASYDAAFADLATWASAL